MAAVESTVDGGASKKETESTNNSPAATATVEPSSPNNSDSTVDVEMASPPSQEEGRRKADKADEGECDDEVKEIVDDDNASDNHAATDEGIAADEDDDDVDFPHEDEDDPATISPTPPPLTIEPTHPPSSSSPMLDDSVVVAPSAANAVAVAVAATPTAIPIPVPVPVVAMSPGAQALSMAAARQIMFDNYTPWVMATYGDSAKTKTITTRKYARIVALLRSLEKDSSSGGENTGGGSSSEAAKFRLWVKSKGFHLGPPAGHPDRDKPGSADLLYLPTGTDKVRQQCGRWDAFLFLSALSNKRDFCRFSSLGSTSGGESAVLIVVVKINKHLRLHVLLAYLDFGNAVPQSILVIESFLHPGEMLTE